MKKILTATILLTIGFSSCAQDKVIPQSELPTEIKTYLDTHFTNNPILQASIDKELFSKSYEVILKDNIKVEFDSKNRVKEIDGNAKLPDNVIPKKILEYVKANYPNNVITDWELDDRNQQVELDNGLDLEFDMNGDFLRIDD